MCIARPDVCGLRPEVVRIRMLSSIEIKSTRLSFGLLRPYFQTMKSPQRLVDISAIHHGVLDNLLNREMLPLIPPQRTEAPFQIWTDASTEAAGGILIHDDEQLSPEDFTYIWPTHLQNLHINVKEALALLLALHLWQPKDTHVTVWVDNTAVIGAVTKGYSPSEQLNTVVKSIINLCEYLNLSITCLYVPSAMNIADSISHSYGDLRVFTVQYADCQCMPSQGRVGAGAVAIESAMTCVMDSTIVKADNIFIIPSPCNLHLETSRLNCK